jgi:hypothetical protein
MKVAYWALLMITLASFPLSIFMLWGKFALFPMIILQVAAGFALAKLADQVEQP